MASRRAAPGTTVLLCLRLPFVVAPAATRDDAFTQERDAARYA
jgi:hypothetical protein